MNEEEAAPADPSFLTRRRIVIGVVAFAIAWGALLLANVLLEKLATSTGAFFSSYGGAFPLSVGFPRVPGHAWLGKTIGRPGSLSPPFGPESPGVFTFALAAALIAALWWGLGSERARPRTVLHAALLGGALVLLGTLLQTPHYGFSYPISGDCYGGIQYYHDALEIQDARAFFSDYVALQPETRVHTRVHPPGAVLTIWALVQVLESPAAVALALFLIGFSLLAVGMASVLSRDLGPEATRFGVLLLLLLPAVQVYTCATIDGPIAGLMLLTVAAFRAERAWVRIVGAATALFLASSLTFPTVFLIPILGMFELATRRSLRDTTAVVLLAVGAHTLVFALSGFNWLGSFRVASVVENPEGFRLFSAPLDYLWTRVEAVGEVALFAGPFVLWLLVRGARSAPRSLETSRLELLTGLACLTYGAMLVAGAYRLGETARTCLYLYPFLVFPIAGMVERGELSQDDQRRLLTVVFVQTVGMQCLGFYVW